MNRAPASTMVLASVISACLTACAAPGSAPSTSIATPSPAESEATATSVGTLPAPRSARPAPSAQDADQRVIARLSVGPTPAHLAIGGNAIWVTNGDNTVTRIDAVTDAVLTITVPGVPLGVAADAAGAWVAINRYVDGAPGTLVVQLDPKTGSILQEVVVPSGPRGVAVDGDVVWVTSGAANIVSRIDPGNGEIVASIPVDGGPAGVRIIGDSVWVASRSGSQISRIDPGTNTVADRVELGGQSVWLAGSDTTLWVASWQATIVYRVDRASGEVVVAELGAPVYPGVAILNDAPWVPAGTKLLRLDPETGDVTDEIDLGSGVGDVEPAGDGQLWVLLPRTSELLRVKPDA